MIVEETVSLLRKNYGSYLDGLVISGVRIGSFMTAVRLSDDSLGIASAEADSEIHCDKKNRDFGEFTPLNIEGRKANELFDTPKKSAVISSLKIAVLNAISSRIIGEKDYKIVRNTDPVDLLDLDQKLTITLVGAFHSYIRKISESGNRLNVLELNENALLPEHKQYFVPAGEYSRVLPASDVVIITGLTLVNNTLDELLNNIPPNARVIITGPSSSILPDVLFSHNVSIIGATRISRPELVFPLISQGAAGYHLFKYCAEKICILKEE